MDGGSQEGSGSNPEEDKKVRIRLKTDPPKDPRSIKAPKNKSAMKKDNDPEHNEPELSHEEHEERSIQQNLSEDPMGHIATGNVTTEQNPPEAQPPESNTQKNEMDIESPQSTENDNKEKNMKADEAEKATIDKMKEGDNDKERAEGNESPRSSDNIKVIGDATTEKQNSGDDPIIITTSTSLPTIQSNRTSEANLPMEQSAPSFSAESEMAKNDGGNSVHSSTSPTILSPVPEQTDDEFQNTTSLGGIKEQADTLPDAGLNDIILNENETKRKDENDTPGQKEDSLVDSRSSKTELGSKTNMGNGELGTENVDANKEMEKSSISSITGSIRQSIETSIMKDSQSKKGSTEINENNNVDRKQESSFNSVNLSVEDTKMASIAEDENGDPNKTGDREERNSNGASGVNLARVSVQNQESPTNTPSSKVAIKVRRKTNEQENGMDENDNRKGIIEEDGNTDEESCEANATTNGSSSLIQASKDQTDNETVEEDANEETMEEPTMSKQKEPSQDQADIQDNGITDESHIISENAEEGTINNVKDDPEKRKNGKDDIPVLLKRTTGSQDLKIAELKDRVRPGQVFIVRGETDSFTVKWAEKRKVLAYKVGSKNTSRFSSVLIETAEQLERASVKRPSILSEFTHPTEGAPKRGILATYLAAANTRRGIKDHLIRDAGTNTDHQTEFTAKENPPDKTFWATDHISQDKEAFGGAEQVQTTTGDGTYQTNNYNYPFLTDYDVNHKREAKK